MTSIGHFGASDDQTIRMFWENRAVETIEVVEAAEDSKVWKKH